MFKIWCKTIVDNKTISSVMFESNQPFEIGNFQNYLNDISYLLEIPSPIVLVKHIKNFIVFNSTSFSEVDFVEKINFEKLVLENPKFI